MPGKPKAELRWFCSADSISLIPLPLPLQKPSPLHSRWAVGILWGKIRLKLSGPTPGLGWFVVVKGQGRHPGSRIREAQSSNWRDSLHTHSPSILSEALRAEALKLKLGHATDPFLNPGSTGSDPRQETSLSFSFQK